MTDTVRVDAHAKLNVFLRVLSKHETGYHGIETAFTLVELCDRLRVERIASGIELEIDGTDLGPVESNLCFKAADLALTTVGTPFGVRIHLTKNIPVQAGLGGGSSDGAATLHAVNALANNAIPRHEVLQLAAKLGADVPFFASGAPFALAWHHGNRLFRIPPPPAHPTLVVMPPTTVRTESAYADLDRQHRYDARGGIALDAEAFRSWGRIGRLGGNDFESTVFGSQPIIRETFEMLAETRPLWVRLTGSGAAVAAVYRSDGALEDAVNLIGQQQHRVIVTATRARPAEGPAPA